MDIRTTVLSLLLACAAGNATAQVQTEPLEAPAQTPEAAPYARQTGSTSFQLPNGQLVTIRSFEPDTTLPDAYRISFEALDLDGDGYISRAEAAAHETLRTEFGGIDTDGDGRLSRQELSGWIR